MKFSLTMVEVYSWVIQMKSIIKLGMLLRWKTKVWKAYSIGVCRHVIGGSLFSGMLKSSLLLSRLVFKTLEGAMELVNHVEVFTGGTIVILEGASLQWGLVNKTLRQITLEENLIMGIIQSCTWATSEFINSCAWPPVRILKCDSCV